MSAIPTVDCQSLPTRLGRIEQRLECRQSFTDLTLYDPFVWLDAQVPCHRVQHLSVIALPHILLSEAGAGLPATPGQRSYYPLPRQLLAAASIV
jgi:hypothetical protein